MKYIKESSNEKKESGLKSFLSNHFNIKNRLYNITIMLLLFSCISVSAQTELSLQEFKLPPESSKVHTWWHWMNNGITKDGITKDLESMKKQGVVQATILNVGLPIVNPVEVPDIMFGTPEWYEMFNWALTEAKRVGISIGIHNCDGWSTSGGPWLTAEESMKLYTWSKTTIKGGKEVSVQLALPPNSRNYYRDYAVVAIPLNEKENSFQTAKAKITINKKVDANAISDGNPFSSVVLKAGDVINIELKSKIEISQVKFQSLILDSYKSYFWGNLNKIGGKFILYSSNDNVNFQKVSNVEFRGVSETKSVSIPKTSAQFFKLECLEVTKKYPLSELELLANNETSSYKPVIPNLLQKTGTIGLANNDDFALMRKNISSTVNEQSVIDLTEKLDKNGLLKWKAPKGNWKVIRFGYTTTGAQNGPSTKFGKGFEVDKMDTIALNKHFNSFGKKLKQEANKITDNTFKFLLIDSWEAGLQNWTKNFPEEFKNRRGYDIIPWIPVLCGEVVGNTQLSEGFLFDFQLTISDLIGDNYYKHFRDLCHRDDLEMHAEVIYGERGMYPSIDVLKTNNYPDLVMSEFWGMDFASENRVYQAKEKPRPRLPLFKGFEGNKQVIASEAYTSLAHYSDSPIELKAWGDEAFCSGVNQMILHSYVHQPTDDKPGVTLWKFGASFNRNNPWWNLSNDWMEYQSRIQYVLQKGEPVVDVVYYIGDQLPQSNYKSISKKMPYGYTAFPCSFDMLVNQAKAIDGKLSFGGSQRYAFLALPEKTNMQLSTLKQIAKLVKDGVVVYGPKPEALLSLTDIKHHSEEFKTIADELWGKSNSSIIDKKYGKGKVVWGKPVNELLKELNVVPSFTTNVAEAKEIMFTHKKVGNDDVYFLFNQQNKALSRELLFRTNNKVPEIWDAVDGTTVKPAIYSVEEAQLRIPVSLQPLQSLIFIIRGDKPEKHIAKVHSGSKQIFPLIEKTEAQFTIPTTTLIENNFEFVSQQNNDYIFTDANGKVIKKSLEAPTVFTIDDFNGTIDFEPVYDEKIPSVGIKNLKSLTESDNPSIKYFGGKATYTINFKAPKKAKKNKEDLYLNLGDVDAVAEVVLNGKHLGYYWVPNSKIAIPNLIQSNNVLEITVATVVRNRFIGDFIEYGEVKNLFTTTTVDKYFDKDKPLKPSGLIGPIQLIQYKKEN
ncbi:alpha-L-rhamnosidase [Lutibacter agarilyticus]|uniref:Alpha-L-rhamnosidase n=1 Tax=Lutibacter agarilyticus TaxID=1109740 RepID=A0A238Z3G6_9FLAO|nr:glycosyl hydrolase [Lutibacter agarilyticus]SNR77916.1 alpha-L-rhamnosidase [Lutibacter agarilyticus]